MDERLLEAAEEYEKTGSVRLTAERLGLSQAAVRRLLLTAGVWSSKTALNVGILHREHPDWTAAQIARELGVSPRTVRMYTPYEDSARRTPEQDETGDRIADGGQCGDHAIWELTKSGVLTVCGSGPMWDYNGNSWGVWEKPRPKWWMRRDGVKVRKIVVEDGITAVGQYAFCTLMELSEVSLPDTVEEIRGGAFLGENRLRTFTIPARVGFVAWDTFYSCVMLEEVRIPAGVRKIQTYAFHACRSLKRLVFLGDAPGLVAGSAFDMCAEDLVVYRRRDAAGFGETWNGYWVELLSE